MTELVENYWKPTGSTSFVCPTSGTFQVSWHQAIVNRPNPFDHETIICIITNCLTHEFRDLINIISDYVKDAIFLTVYKNEIKTNTQFTLLLDKNQDNLNIDSVPITAAAGDRMSLILTSNIDLTINFSANLSRID